MSFGTVYSALDLKAKYHIPEYDINGTIKDEYERCINDTSVPKEKLVHLINLASVEYQMVKEGNVSEKFITTTKEILSGLYLLLERQIQIEKKQNYYLLLGQIKYDYYINHIKTQHITNPKCKIQIDFENPDDTVTFLIKNLDDDIIGMKELSYKNELINYDYSELIKALDLEYIFKTRDNIWDDKQNNTIEIE